eukprot:5666007-Ditylum_brightwellii.AAC.1
MGNVIEYIPETDSVIPPFDDNDLCIISLPSVILVSYEHGLTAETLNSHQLELMEDYHPSMGLWCDTMQYQFSSQSGMSVLTQHANNVPDNQGFESQASGAVDVVQLNDDNNDDEPFIQGIKQCLE